MFFYKLFDNQVDQLVFEHDGLDDAAALLGQELGNFLVGGGIGDENESLESALRRFKRSCAKEGVIAEVKKREHYVSPSLKRKQKSEAARKNKRKFY